MFITFNTFLFCSTILAKSNSDFSFFFFLYSARGVQVKRLPYVALNKSAQPLAWPFFILRTFPDLTRHAQIKGSFFWLTGDPAPPPLHALPVSRLTSLPSLPCRQMKFNPSLLLFHILKIYHFKSRGSLWPPLNAARGHSRITSINTVRTLKTFSSTPGAPPSASGGPLSPVAPRGPVKDIKDETSMGATWRMRNRAGEKATLENMTPEISPGIEERGGVLLLKHPSQNHNTETSLTNTGIQVNILLVLYQMLMINYLTYQGNVQFNLHCCSKVFCL